METTFGIDLASKPRNTAVCAIAWYDGRAEVRSLLRSRSNGSDLHDKLLSTAARGLSPIEGLDDGWGPVGRPTKVAIDAPFGWPQPFAEAIAAHQAGRPWPELLDNPRDPFERRETNRFVRECTGKVPLSVSTDRIAYPAMRCAVILGDLSHHVEPELLARDGSGLVAEAYPDAALRCWLPDIWAAAPKDSYKGNSPSAAARRQLVVKTLLKALGFGFVISGESIEACHRSDDCLDALVCALVARAVARGQTMLPTTAKRRELALIEGWIHLPNGPLQQLI